MANYIPHGWLLDVQDPGWTLGTGWSMDTTAGELINDGTGSWDGCDYYEYEAIPPGYTGTIYWSVEVTEFTSGALEYFEICGISQTVPTGVGVYSGQIASGYDHHGLFFLRDDGGWVGKIKHVWVGDTPPPSDTTAPNLSSPTATSITSGSAVLGATTDEANGIAHAIIVPNGEESTPTNQEIIDASYTNQIAVAADLTISATGAFTFTSTIGLSASTAYGYAIVHVDSNGNEDAGSRAEGTFTTSATGTTYTLRLDNLGPDHRWSFDGVYTDSIGSADGTNSGTIVTDSAICEDTTNCMTTNGTADRVTLPSTTDINNSAQSIRTIAGWFSTTAVQDPPKRIYGEGDATQSIAFILGWGNNVIFEVDDPNFNVQIYADTYLEPNRAYHLCLIFEGNGTNNIVRAYLDGILQLKAVPSDRQPNSATLTARSAGEFGDPAGTVAVGGTAVLLNSPVNGKYNQWISFDGIALTTAQVREILFESGALPDITITSDTESNMQTDLDNYSSSSRNNAPLCIRVEDVTGSGNLDLTATNITFSEYASIHVQWMGTGVLTWTNASGSNASIGSAPNGGSINFVLPVTVKFTVLDATSGSPIVGARVLMEADSGGDLAIGTDIILDITDSNGQVSITFNHVNDQPYTLKVRKASSSTYYKEAKQTGTITSKGIDNTILMVADE